MTLFDIITAVKGQFPDINKDDICRIVNELEDRIFNEFFLPSGIKRQRQKLNPKTDINEKLLLEEENFSLYIYFIYAILSLRELDFEGSNSYSVLFNEKFKELAIFYRRNNLPIKNTILKGGI